MGCSTRESQLSLNWISAISPHGLAMGSATRYRSAPSILVDDCVHAAKWRVWCTHWGHYNYQRSNRLNRITSFSHCRRVGQICACDDVEVVAAAQSAFHHKPTCQAAATTYLDISTPHGPRSPWCLLYISSMSQAISRKCPVSSGDSAVWLPLPIQQHNDWLRPDPLALPHLTRLPARCL